MCKNKGALYDIVRSTNFLSPHIPMMSVCALVNVYNELYTLNVSKASFLQDNIHNGYLLRHHLSESHYEAIVKGPTWIIVTLMKIKVICIVINSAHLLWDQTVVTCDSWVASWVFKDQGVSYEIIGPKRPYLGKTYIKASISRPIILRKISNLSVHLCLRAFWDLMLNTLSVFSHTYLFCLWIVVGSVGS